MTTTLIKLNQLNLSGNLVLGGFTLTVPATLTVAGLGIANVFTTTQQITVPTTTLQGLILKTSDDNTTKNLLEWKSSTDVLLGGIQSYGALFSYGKGGITTNVIIGLEAGAGITSGTSNFALGYRALKTLTITSNNVAIGQRALELCIGSQNVAIGSQAGANATGADNTFVGYNAGVAITTGTGNVAIGSGALTFNRIKGGNIAIGYNALKGVSTYSYDTSNIGIGSWAGGLISTGGSNICIGDSSGFTIGAAEKNIFIGNNSGGLVVGSGNVAIGHQTMFSATTGGSNVYVGFQTGFTNVGGSSNIFIGRAAGYRQTSSGKLIIDNTERATIAIEITNAIIYGEMGATPSVQTLRINAVETIAVNTTTANAPLKVLDLNAYVSTAATGFANGGGVGMTFTGETATDGTSQLMASANAVWVDATNATRKAKLKLSAYDTAVRLGMEIEASGSAPMLGFFGGTTAIQQILNAYTSDGEGAAYTGIDNAQAGTPYATVADLNQLRVAYETLRASYDDLRTKLQTSTLVA